MYERPTSKNKSEMIRKIEILSTDICLEYLKITVI